MEAAYPRVRLSPMAMFLEDGGCSAWVRQPRRETQRSMEAVARLARSRIGQDFARCEMIGQVFSRLRHIPYPGPRAPLERRFCGELAAAVLQETDQFRLQGLPRELLTPKSVQSCPLNAFWHQGRAGPSLKGLNTV